MNKIKSIVNYQPIEWKGDMVKLLDQTLLPAEESIWKSPITAK